MITKERKSNYTVLGGMAGSSMDGLDLALVQFKSSEVGWEFEILKAMTISYPEKIYNALKKSHNQSKDVLNELDHIFGSWIAKEINSSFVNQGNKIDLISIHGHTVIHDPKMGVSWQLGNGATIAKSTEITTLTDFRSQDIAQGGEGAPLVPFGDFNLFSQYDMCLNLGGIANISHKQKKIAWDICPCNQVLNHFAKKLNLRFDDKGDIARTGTINNELINKISEDNFFIRKPPKSLPNKYFDESILDHVIPEDGLRSYVEFIASQLARDLSFEERSNLKMLVTGGGAFNKFLVEKITSHLPMWSIEVPDDELISFKEAIIFAFLGLKRYLGEVNILRSVTGGSKDISAGVIHLPK